MSIPTLALELRLRWRMTAIAAGALFSFLLMLGALFPAIGGTFGQLKVGEGVSNLLGGADYGSLNGYLKAEAVSILAPLICGGIAVAFAAGSTAGEEEDGILSLVLAHPLQRSAAVLGKAAGLALAVLALGWVNWVGLVAAVALAGGGIGAGDLAAQSLHLTFFALVLGSLGLALGAATGQRALALGGAAGFGILAFLINGFAPLVGAIEWLKYISPFYYYSGHDPLSNGVDFGDLAVMGVSALALVAIAVAGLRRRDLRG